MRLREVYGESFGEMGDVTLFRKVVTVDENIELVVGFISHGGIDAGEYTIFVEEHTTVVIERITLPGSLKEMLPDFGTASRK